MDNGQRTLYALRRLVAALTPVSHWQRAPYSGAVQLVRVRAADGVEIAATLFPRRRRDLLIVCHGFASSQRSVGIVWLAEALAGPWDVLTFDWRGYGASGGRASLGGGEALDLAAVVDYARARGYRRVGVIAESMGGLIALATLGSAGLPVDRVATLAAPADYALTGGVRPHLVRHVAPRPALRPFAPLLGFRLGPLSLLRPLDVIGQIDLPLLLVHGATDTTVPLRNARLLHERAPNATLRIYPGVGHGVEAMRAQVPRTLLDDLRSHFALL
jgi:pimeloyl-ACP methyl ester carboxylesterase